MEDKNWLRNETNQNIPKIHIPLSSTREDTQINSSNNNVPSLSPEWFRNPCDKRPPLNIRWPTIIRFEWPSLAWETVSCIHKSPSIRSCAPPKSVLCSKYDLSLFPRFAYHINNTRRRTLDLLSLSHSHTEQDDCFRSFVECGWLGVYFRVCLEKPKSKRKLRN